MKTKDVPTITSPAVDTRS